MYKVWPKLRGYDYVFAYMQWQRFHVINKENLTCYQIMKLFPVSLTVACSCRLIGGVHVHMYYDMRYKGSI